jgi:hypothetical protein
MGLKLLNLIIKRFHSKAFSPACLFRFSESSFPSPNYDRVSRGEGEDGVSGWILSSGKPGRKILKAGWIYLG